MAKETRPKADGDELLTPELAPTELAGGDGTRTGPRAVGRHVDPRAVGRFRVDAQLGSGGMGDVYRAYDTVLDRPVALKVLRTDRSADDDQRMRRVVREARAAAALTHPNAVTVFDIGEADAEVFIAMELLEGEDLRSVLERGDASLDDRLRWLLEAARALAAAHERGLVHRDVKPENMFVCKGGTLKLLDFGIAKRDDEDVGHADADASALSMGPSSLRTTEGRRIGTPRYMAPEQHAGDSTDARTDEYAWGLVAFELLTGAHVVADLRTMTRDGAAPSPAPTAATERLAALRAKAPEVPEPIAQAIARALEPRKEDRFPSMAEIVSVLERRASPPSSSTPDAPVPASAPEAEQPRAPRRATRAWIVGALALTAAGAAAAALLLSRGKLHAARALPPACRVESTRTIAVGADDRATLLPTGAAVIARGIRRGVQLEREAPGGMVPILRSPLLTAIGHDYDELRLRGITYQGAPAVFLDFFQGDRGAFVGVWSEDGSTANRRIFGAVSGIAATELDNEVVVVATTLDVTRRGRGLENGAEAYILRAQGLTVHALIEEGSASGPAVATSGDRIAVTYNYRDELHFALLGKDLQRIGDALKVASTQSFPALAFSGDTATVFWTDDRAGKTRLTGASFTLGGTAFSPPKVAIDEPLSPKMPVTARLPNGSWTVAWVASTGGLSTLRVSPIGPGGSLTGPSEVAKASTIDALQAMSTDRGVDYWWYESESMIRIASVTCAAPGAP